jgi:anti-sigma B factor antagonist
MEIAVAHQQTVTVVTPMGDIDALTATEFAGLLSRQLQAGNPQLVADFSQVSYMSSAGLRALLATLKEARQQGGDFRLAAVPPNVQQVLTMTGFNTIFKIFPTVEATVASFGQ